MWWLITAVVCTIVGLFFATCFVFALSDYGDGESMFATTIIIIVVIMYTIVNSITYSNSGYGQMQTGASILVEHDVDGNSRREILEIPLSNVAFRIINDSASSMAINFDAISEPTPGYVAKDTPSGCHAQIRWGWWTRKCATTSTTVTSTENEGLSGLLHKALASNPGKFVTMNVTTSEYQQILGSADSTTETEIPTPSPTTR